MPIPTNVAQPRNIYDPTDPRNSHIYASKSAVPEWKKGLGAFVDETQGLLSAGVGLAAEGVKPILPDVAKPYAEKVRDWGLDSYQRNMEEATTGVQTPNVARIEDIKLTEPGGLGRLGDWTAYHGTKGVAQGLSFLGTGGATGLVGKKLAQAGVEKGVKALAKAKIGSAIPGTGVLTEGLKQTAQKVVADAGRKGFNRGFVAGGLGYGTALEGGSSFGELVRPSDPNETPLAPEDAVGPAAAYGLAAGAVEFLPEVAIAKALGLDQGFKSFMKKAVKDLVAGTVDKTLKKKLISFAGAVGKGAAIGGAVEGTEEGVQSLLQTAAHRWAREEPVLAALSEEELSDLYNSVAAGSLPGAAFGGTVGGVRNVGQQRFLARANEAFERARTNAGLAPTVEEAGAETTAPGQAPPPAPVVEEPTVLGQRPDAGLADAGQPAYQPTSYIKGVPEEEVAVPATQEAQAEPRAPADISAIQVAQAYAEGLEEGRIAEANFDQQYGRGAYAKLAQGSAHEQASPAQQAVLDQEAANAAKAAEAEAEVVSGWTQTDPEAFVYEGQKVQTPEGTAWQGKWEVAKNDKTGEWEAFNSQGELFGKYPTAENAQESIELQEIIKDPELEQAALAAGVDLDDAQAYVALAAMNLGPESMAGFKETLVYKYNSWQTVANAVASTNLSGKINAYQAKWADKHQKPAKPVKQSWLDEAAESFAAEPPEAYYDPDQVVAEPEPTSTQTKAAKLAELPASFKAVVYKDAAGIKHAFGPNLEYLGESEEYSVASDKLVDAGLVGSDEEVYYIYASDSGGPVFQRLVDKQKPGGKTLQELLNTHGANFPWKAAVLKTPEGYHVFGPNSEYLGKTDYYTEASALHGQPAGPTAYFNSVNSPEAKRLQRLIPTQTKSAAPAPTQAPSPTTPTWDQLSKVSGQKGSQDGGIYEDESGQRYYVKWPKTAENAVSEVFAAQLMGKLGFVVPETALLDTPKGKAVTSKWMDNLVSAKDQVESGQWTQLHKAFAAAAWLGHWDIVGLNFDNVMQDSNGHMVLLDFGGTLKYRAQGGVKPSWSSHVGELSSLRDPAVNPNAAKAFAGMTEADLISGVEQLAKITTPELLALADVSGLTTEDAYTLAERRDFLLQHVQELQAKYDVETLQTWVKDYDGTAAIENALANPAVSPHQTVWAEVTPENARYGVIVIDPEKGKVLIRKVKGGYGGYVWSWAKGGAEQGETPVQAAKRETLEELGVETQLVGQIPGVFTSNSGTGAAFYVGVVHPNFDVATSNPGTETEETRWVSYDQAKALLGQTTIELGKARDLEILDVVFGKAKLSHLAYLPIKKGEVNAREFFESGDFKTTFGASFEPIAKKLYWSELTQYQKLTVAVASRFMEPTSPLYKAGIVPTKAQVNKEVARIKAAFKVWSGGVALPDVLPGDSKLAPEGPLETGKPVTLSVYHHLSAGDIKGGYINFAKYGGSGHSGSDTKHAFFAFGAESSAEYQNGKYLKLYVTFKNPKVIDHGGHSWHSFKDQILAAKAEGHDGLIAYAVTDLGVIDTQVMMWVPEQVKTQELENLGYDGLDPILWHSRSMAGTERKGIARIVEGLETEFGKAFVKAATHAGILEIVPNGPAGVQAEFDEATGKIRLYANNLTSSPAAVLMHEGSHATLETYLGQDLGKFVKDVQAQARAGNASASQALAAATEDKYTYQRAALGLPAAELTPETLAETKKALASSPNKERITEIGDKIFKQESLAYYAEFSASRPTGLSRRFLDRLKAGWLSSDRGMLLGMYKPKLTEGVMVELARKSTQFSVALKNAADRLQKEMDAAAETGERVRIEYRDRSGLEGTVDVLDEVRRLESRVQISPDERKANFERWFAGSKVTDKEGRPLVVYHGTKYDFNEFAVGQPYYDEDTGVQRFGSGADATAYLGSHFAKEPEVASKFAKGLYGEAKDNKFGGRVMPVYLSLKNPLKISEIDLRNMLVSADLSSSEYVEVAIEDFAQDSGKSPDEIWEEYSDPNTDTRAIVNDMAMEVSLKNEDFPNEFAQQQAEAVRAQLQKEGYDGIEYDNWVEGGISYIIFEPQQAKSAVGNRGTFSSESADILKSRVGAGQAMWRSGLMDALEQPKAPGKATAAQWKGWLKSQPGVKKEEMEDLGLEDWLGAQEGSVRKEDVLGFVEKGGVKLEEVVHGAGSLKEELAAASRRVNMAQTTEEYQAAVAELMALQNKELPNTTKFSQYQLPGGENYRELLVTVPANEEVQQISKEELEELNRYRFMSPNALKANGLWERYKELDDLHLRRYNPDKDTGVFKSSHWSEPNVLVHIRFNERTDASGAKVLFVEEVQSDWHQEGRKKGYGEEGKLKIKNKTTGEILEVPPGEGAMPYAYSLNWAPRDIELVNAETPVPNAPMKSTSTWAMLGMKRAIRWAAENGFDRVAWTPGEVQADRYDLSKQIREIQYIKTEEGLYQVGATALNGEGIDFPKNAYTADELEGIVGKEIAQKIVDGEGKKYYGMDFMTLAGLDLKVGGEGMRAFYDKMLPNELNKYLKKFGGRVEPNTFNTPDGELYAWSFPITPALREEAFSGQKLYSRQAPTFKSWLFTDSLSADVEDVNRPGLANSLYYNYVDMFGALERKAPDVFEVFNLARSKKAHYQTVLQEGLQHDFIELAAKSKIDVDQLGLWLAARHVIEDKVNLRLALENSKEYAKKLSDMISPLLPHGQKTLMAQEISGILKSGDPQDIIQQRMMALVEKWFDHQLPSGQRAKAHQGSQLNPGIADLYLDWNNLKDHGSGLRTPDLVDPAILPLIQSQLPIASDLYAEAQANSDWPELSRMMKELTNETVNVLVRGRVLTQEQGQKLLTKYPHYVPLQREPYDVPNEVAQIFSGGQGGGKVVKTRAGSESDLPVVHVIQNAFAQRSAAISAAEQNLARIYFGDEILRNKDLWSDWFHVAEDGDHVPGRDKNGFVTDRVVGGGPADIPYLKDGKRLLIVPNKQNQRAALLSKAIQNLEPQQVSGVLKLMSGVNSWIRWVNISASPAFMAVNLPRDIWTAVLNIKAAGLESKDLKSNLPAAGKALWEVFVQKRFNPANPTHRLLREWEESGGRISFVESLRQNDDSFNSLESMIRRRQGIFSAGPAQMTSETAGAMIDWGRNKLESLEKFNIMLENISRFAAYKTARDAGWARGKAALLSKDVTTNFDRRGFRATILSTWWLFYNASVQGNAQVVRNILTGPAKEKLVTAVGGLMLFAFMNDMLGAAISDDDDDDGRLNWDSFGEWEKERFARFPIGVPVGDGAKYATVPLPWVFNVFWRAGEMFSEAVRGVRPWGSIAPDLAGLAMGAFNPISSTDTTLTQTLSPTALDPLMQILENRSPFGVPLRPERYPGQENQPASWMAFDSTPKFYKWLAREVNSLTGGSAAEQGLVDQYPADYKVIADTLLGSGGRFVLSAFGPLFDGRPATVKDIPLVSTYVKQPKDPIESQLFHERIAQIEQAKHAVKVFSEGAQRDSVELRRAREEYAPMLRMQDAANDIQRQIKDLRAKRKIAEARGRDDQAQEITKSIQRQMERFNRLWAGRVGN